MFESRLRNCQICTFEISISAPERLVMARNRIRPQVAVHNLPERFGLIGTEPLNLCSLCCVAENTDYTTTGNEPLRLGFGDIMQVVTCLAYS
jgi:hypothetical protein